MSAVNQQTRDRRPSWAAHTCEPGAQTQALPWPLPPLDSWPLKPSTSNWWRISSLAGRQHGFPWLLLIMVVLAAHPVRVPVGSETVSIFDIAVLPLGLIFIGRRIARRPMEWGPRIVIMALAAQFSITLASMTWAVNFENALVATIVAGESLAVYLMVMDFATGLRPTHTVGVLALYGILLVASSTATFFGVPGFQPPATAPDPWGWTARLSHSLIGKSNNLATLLVPIAPVAWYAGKKLNRWWLTAAGWTMLAATLLTLSRGALVALVGIAVIWVVVRPRQRRSSGSHRRSREAGTLAVTVFVILAGGLLVLLGLNAVQGRGVTLGERLSFGDNGRFDLYRQALTRAAERFLGFGPGASEVDIHNAYLQALVNFGVVLGMIFVITFVFLVAPWFSSAYRSASEGTRKATGLAFAGVFIICMVESSYEGTLLRQLIWFVFALTVAWHTTTSREIGGDTGWDRPTDSRWVALNGDLWPRRPPPPSASAIASGGGSV